MTTTQAAVLRSADGAHAIEDIDLGELRSDEVLVDVAGCGFCHTDLLPRGGDASPAPPPIILGHEGSGVIAAVGANVTDFSVGDHVIASFDSCGTCRACVLGGPAYCVEFEARNLTGRYVDGGTPATDAHGHAVSSRWFAQSFFADQAVARQRNLVRVDPELPIETLGPLGCGIQTGAGSVINEMGMTAGQTIAVFGVGAVGLAAVMAARLCGASDIVAVDLDPMRLEMARELGATRTVLGDADDVVEQVRGGGSGLDLSFDTTAVGSVMAASIAVLARPGQAVFVGSGADLLSIPPYELAGKQLTFVFEGSAVPQLFLPQLIELWRQQRFPFDKFVKTYPLEAINDAEADAIAGRTIKPVLVPGD